MVKPCCSKNRTNSYPYKCLLTEVSLIRANYCFVFILLQNVSQSVQSLCNVFTFKLGLWNEIVIIISSNHMVGVLFLHPVIILLNQYCTPLLELQASNRSTCLIVYDVPGVGFFFCSLLVMGVALFPDTF